MASDNLYDYYLPSKITAIVFAAIFAILTATHLWRIIATRQWFGMAIVVGGLFETVALIARVISNMHPNESAPYIIQYVLILLAPILYTASVYMFLGRLIRVSGHPELSLIRINWITKIFVVCDILCFLIQAFGGVSIANLTNSNDSASEIAHRMNIASNVILGGLALQVIFFVIFALCAMIFHIRVSKSGVAETVDPSLRINMMLISLYIASLLVTGRNMYRVVEYKTGSHGYLQEHEWPTYGLDVGLMALLMCFTLFWYIADTKARLKGSKYAAVHDGDKIWSDDMHSENYPLAPSGVMHAPYGNPQDTAYDSSYGRYYGVEHGYRAA
ncbi:uncharacterized protein N7483_004604 [Penicillium malachiteum]|uniref:uncharacterized protein n=1 Tax=Penicillium malachiteum TaxID=1324776 RepID=UPI002546F19A|nr:uncharacterized protein N7483_004604 [Penicillium malachiteum]KAJ5730096.1 hypothetical protein N7483_004604 [Penicillium malachiteum]